VTLDEGVAFTGTVQDAFGNPDDGRWRRWIFLDSLFDQERLAANVGGVYENGDG
jgi:hypothetical protein